MTLNASLCPFDQFFGLDGKPLENGYVYIGVVGLDPVTNPVPIFYDASLTIPAPNPMRTIAGYVAKAGAPTNVFTSGNYSTKVTDKNNVQVYYVPDFFATTNFNDLRTDLSASYGSSLIGFIAAGVGAVIRTVQERLREEVLVTDYMTAAQRADVLARTALVDTSPAWTLAINRLIAIRGKRIIAPAGTYLLNGGPVSPDGYKNGILLPDTNGDFSTGNGITIVGDGVETVFKAGSPNMVVLRHSRLYSGGENFKIDGAGLANVIGRGIIPEDMTQTTELVSQSYACYQNVTVENCTESTVIMPGPTVLGADSGCFYHRFYNDITNNNVRHLWLKKDVTGAGNRTTRSSWYSSVFTRGNTGVLIDGGTELDFYSPNFEMINTGVSPSAIPTAFNYNDSNPANIRIFGGYAEACNVSVTSIHPEHVQLVGFYQTGSPSASEYYMGRNILGRLNVAKLANMQAYINAGGEGFAGFVIDPDGNGQKTIAVQTAGVERLRFFNGTTTIKDGNVVFSTVGNNVISQPAGATQLNVCNNQYWRSVAGVDVVRLDASGALSLFPASDNTVVLGQSGLRWSAVWAANGVIQTSDPRTKWDILDSVLGLDFINKLRPVQYKFKVGGNKIVGVREVKPAVTSICEETGEVLIDVPAETENIIEAQPGKRQHFGFLTTEVKSAMGDVDFGGYIKTDMNDPESEEALRYDEFIAPLVRAVQELSQEVKDLKKSLKNHEH
jgi:hypothetical protein